MKMTTIQVNVYEVGDVIEMTRESFNLDAKRRSFADSTRAVIVEVRQRQDKLFSYKVVASNGKTFTLTPSDQGKEQYVGHIDLGLLFGGGE